MRRVVQALPEAEAARDRGAFFGSILGTVNHLLWADTIWLSRFRGTGPPAGGIAGSVAFTPDVATWAAMRAGTDAAIVDWAEDLRDCEGTIAWYSGALERDVSRSRSTIYTHFFNHQTHHRGQVHAMLTAAGTRPDVTDLFAMPDLP